MLLTESHVVPTNAENIFEGLTFVDDIKKKMD